MGARNNGLLPKSKLPILIFEYFTIYYNIAKIQLFCSILVTGHRYFRQLGRFPFYLYLAANIWQAKLLYYQLLRLS